MDNLNIYNRARSVPNEAKKKIGGGTLGNLGFTDINPMWRIKILTEIFGPCGMGWWYTVDKQWLETAPNGEIKAFCNITLYYGDPDTGEVSKGIFGTGGSSFASKTHASDECYKMALTDAISVAAKALGVAADVYFEKDRTKYNIEGGAAPAKPTAEAASVDPIKAVKDKKPETGTSTFVTADRLKDLFEAGKLHGWDEQKTTAAVQKRFGKLPNQLSEAEYATVFNGLMGIKNEQEGEQG